MAKQVRRVRQLVRDDKGNYKVGAVTVPDDVILAAAENIITERFYRETVITEPAHSIKFIQAKLGLKEAENFGVIFLDNKHQILGWEVMFRGSIGESAVYPREVAKRALEYNAAAVVLGHNHPSGVCQPSKADEFITTKLVEALKLMDIRVLDHIIVGGENYFSFAEKGML